MQHFTIRHGARAPAFRPPVGPVERVDGVGAVAILGEDWPGFRPHMEVETGARVTKGQTLFTDRTHPEIRFVAPVSGVVESLTFGHRRTLDALVLRIDGEEPVSGPPPDAALRTAPRKTLLSNGFWPAFQARPFGIIPAPDATPAGIVVNAVQAAPQAPDAVIVLRERLEAFRLGCDVLTELTPGSVHVAQSPGPPLGPDHARVRHASFSGTLAAGLSGTQIDRLCPGEAVWSIGYQDVAAIGHFFASGGFSGRQVVSVTGPMATPPRLLDVPLGARIADLPGTEGVRLFAGRSATGREAAYLGRFDDQITLCPPKETPLPFSSRSQQVAAAIPSRALDRAIAVDVLAVPLLRALSVGDAEAARRLGCLALVEEDLAAATGACTSGIDYGQCLRRVLNDLMAEAA